MPIPGEKWATRYTDGRMCTLTTPFHHPPEHGATNADWYQWTRFDDDNIMVPVNTYDEAKCDATLSGWDADIHAINTYERERMMGHPKNWTRCLNLQGNAA